MLLAATVASVGQQTSPHESLQIQDRTEVFQRQRDSQKVRFVRDIVGANGIKTTTVYEYTQLESGLNRQDQRGNWVETEESIVPVPGGGKFEGANHTIHFASFPDVQGAVKVTQRGSRDLVSHVLGVSYYNKESGESVLIGKIRRVNGVIISKREVVYTNAFEGLDADLRYIATRSSFEQDVVFRSPPPPPEDFGLDPRHTQIEVLTEFLEFSEPQISVYNRNSTRSGVQALVPDIELQFGDLRIVEGQSFSLGEQNGAESPESTPKLVRKEWLKIADRQFLIEFLDFDEVQNEINALPRRSGARIEIPLRSRGRSNRPIPTTRPEMEQAGVSERIDSLKIDPQSKRHFTERAFVMDYVSQIGTSLSGYTFRGDTTYYISGSVTLSGATKFEGGTVIKFPKYSPTGGRLMVVGSSSTVQFIAGQYRPVVFTACDDDTVGDIIAGSTGAPWGYYYADAALDYNTGGGGAALLANNIIIKYARLGLKIKYNGVYNSPNVVKHSQFSRCYKGISVDSATAHILNAHFFSDAGAGAAIETAAAYVVGQHLTVQGMGSVCSGASSTFNAVNCLYYGNYSLVNGVSYFPTSTAAAVNNPFVFVDLLNEPLGSRGYGYLYDSTYRNVGSTSIDSGLAADLKRRTTYAPGTFSSSTGFPTGVLRDTDTPDLGFHYDPIDCIATSGSVSSGSTLNIPAGYCVAVTGSRGFLVNGYNLGALGSPTTRSWLVRHECVQEGEGTHSGLGIRNLVEMESQYASGTVALDFNFCGFATLAGGRVLSASPKTTLIKISNCEVFGGEIIFQTVPELNRTIAIWNSLFVRSKVEVTSPTSSAVQFLSRLSTFDRCDVNLSPSSQNSWLLGDNLFANSTITQNSSPIAGRFNAYLNPLGVTRISPTSTSDLILTSHTFLSGALGDYYIPSGSLLVNRGSENADLVGMFHATTSNVNTREGQSRLDIGYHYYSLNGSSVPWDSDSDGFPDYLEDATGRVFLNNTAISGGTGPSQGFKVYITRPRNGENKP